MTSTVSNKRAILDFLNGYTDIPRNSVVKQPMKAQKVIPNLNKASMRTFSAKVKTPLTKQTMIEAISSSPPDTIEGIICTNKRNRYTETLINTPVKKLKKEIFSSPLTPSDNIFSSANELKSSPELLREELNYEDEFQIIPNYKSIKFKFSLNINRAGKACITGGTSTTHNKVIFTQSLLPNTVEECSNLKFNKKRVLGLLKQMKSKKTSDFKSLTYRPLKNINVPLDDISCDFPCSSPPAPPNTSSIPSTPNYMSAFQFKTGFTPNFETDESLYVPGNLDQFKNERQHCAFKLSSGDPLLVNDSDINHMELLFHTNPNLQDSLLPSNLPKGQLHHSTSSLCINTSSLVFVKPDSNNHKNRSNTISHIKYTTKTPSTPSTHLENQISIQFTPLIQQTMEGSLCKHIPDTFNYNANWEKTSTIPIRLEHDDARLALQKLMGKK